jgi:hypothetical protein
MKTISLIVHLDDNLDMEGVTIVENTTDIKTDSNLLRYLCVTLWESLEANKTELDLYDELNDIGIGHPKE